MQQQLMSPVTDRNSRYRRSPVVVLIEEVLLSPDIGRYCIYSRCSSSLAMYHPVTCRRFQKVAIRKGSGCTPQVVFRSGDLVPRSRRDMGLYRPGRDCRPLCYRQTTCTREFIRQNASLSRTEISELATPGHHGAWRYGTADGDWPRRS